MVAVLYPEGFNLRKEWSQAKDADSLLDLFDIDGLLVLRLIALWWRLEARTRREATKVRGVRQSDVLAVPTKFIKDKWLDATHAVVSAIAHARKHFGVLERAMIPSESMLLTLAAFMGKYRKKVPDTLVARWWWTSCLSQSHAQGANTQVVIDADRILDSANTSEEEVDLDVTAVLKQPLARNGIAASGLAGALVAAGAKNPLTGEPLTAQTSEELELISFRKLIDSEWQDDPIVGELVVIPKGTTSAIRHRTAQRWGEHETKELWSSQLISGLSAEVSIPKIVGASISLRSKLMSRLADGRGGE